MANQAQIRVLLVDDQSILRQGLSALLGIEPDLVIVGEAENGEAALALVEATQPQVVLMDMRMPVMDGVAATAAIATHHPHIHVLVLTTFDDDALIGEALRVGAKGYLLKDTPSEELAAAIRAVAKGYSQFGPGILQKMVTGLAPPAESLPAGFEALTPRERDVLKLLGEGASNREIARQLYLSEGTVKNHVTNLLGRLGLRDRTQAALLAAKVKDSL